MKNYALIISLTLLAACNNSTQKVEEAKHDSLNNEGDKKVEYILQNDDSLIKAKEKELLEKYK